jgi:tetratricopeptide (TPR) repeat protein
MTDAHQFTPPAPSRAIRVFVSSTFRDMQGERDELVKRVFPQLRSLCEQRAVAWGEVDLRWGVTDEQAAEGQVLPICLEEIRRCRPFFIGLLGERYGWIPDEIAAELIEQQPYLAQHRNRSVTELEILHGVLNDPEMAGHAFFHFRSPAYVDSLPAEERSACREEATAQEIERYGAEEAERRAGERRRKLEALKERIRASGLPVHEGYPTPQAVGERILADLTVVIDRLYPEGTQPDPLDRETAEHKAFAHSRAGVYIGGERYFGRLDAHAKGDGPPLVVLGESGTGKSALLANWALRYRDKPATVVPPAKASLWSRLTHRSQPDSSPAKPPLVLTHFIGATPHSADWAAMLRRIMGELQRRLGIEGDIPDQPDALRVAFANCLSMAAERGRVVLILDGLNQLEDRDQAPDLEWLPPQIPANVRLVLSTLPGRPLDELRKRGWPVLEVQPLTVDERRRLIVDYLAQYTKALDSAHLARVAQAPQCANPLYLRTLLEELRLFGVHEQLDKRIGHYLEAGTVAHLYEKVLARYEEDYERDRRGLVGEAMGLLWAARRGLSEAELLDLLGKDGQPLPQAAWSPLYLAAEASLVDRSGLLGFFHDYLRQAVERQYLSGEEAQRAAHLRLADYFGGREIGARRVDEEPWQLAQAQAWERLYALLGDLPFLYDAWQANAYEVQAYWARVEAGSDLRMVSAYRGVLDAPGDHDAAFVWKLSLLLSGTGHPVEALSLDEHLAEDCRRTGDRAGLAGALQNQAVILWARGDLDEAMALHKKAERLYRELGDNAGLQGSLGNQALILSNRGDLEGAMALHKEEERLCRELGDKHGLATSLGNQALTTHIRGDLDRAMVLHKEAERLCRELGDKAGLWRALSNQGVILKDRGDLEGAMVLHKEVERLCRELGDKAGLCRTLCNQAVILCGRGDLQGAMLLHKEAECLCRELGDTELLATSLANQASILGAGLNQPREALALADEAYRLAADCGYASLVQQIEAIRAAVRQCL